MPDTVAVLGGGVGGLSAAHELIERGFHVEVYESKPVMGGKARSIPVAGSGTGGRRDLPGEPGFRWRVRLGPTSPGTRPRPKTSRICAYSSASCSPPGAFRPPRSTSSSAV